MDTLYTSRGEPIAYIDDDGQSIYLFNLVSGRLDL